MDKPLQYSPGFPTVQVKARSRQQVSAAATAVAAAAIAVAVAAEATAVAAAAEEDNSSLTYIITAIGFINLITHLTGRKYIGFNTIV